ncbi:flagellar basal body-associated FliL family protein [Methylophaga sp. OBS1]|uniref:flagellar basal body-associated FliL family protein n=1 Tax=Methylophaga sp. OBS1 TaxID=2991933 RepID=UPI002255C193|nr:flagellar basal body-associated FliL family protein [Methylophaga sp. OBS1]MCX4192941.1 flagellar basal body-associated FliL family protein [Methylophaga sp. OBS1]
MAEKQDDIEVAEEKNTKTTKILVVVIAILLLAIIGLGVFLFMGNGEEDAAEVTEPVKQPPVYYTIEEPFIVNFSEQSDGQVRYMQVKMKVMARDQAVIDAVQTHLPAIQHELLMLLFSQNYDGLLTSEGTQALQQACLETINRILQSETSLENELEAVYFTSFLMQ